MERYEREYSWERKAKLEQGIALMLEAITGQCPERWPDGLRETPHRAAGMFQECMQGMEYTNAEIAELFNKCFEEPEARDMVIMRDIPAFSFCEHHIALMYNLKITVAYIPHGRVIGLSKIARIVDLVTKRLQLQERIGEDIAWIMEKICNTNDCMVCITGEHSCMTARGINKPGVKTSTVVAHGEFKLRPDLLNVVLEG